MLIWTSRISADALDAPKAIEPATKAAASFECFTMFLPCLCPSQTTVVAKRLGNWLTSELMIDQKSIIFIKTRKTKFFQIVITKLQVFREGGTILKPSNLGVRNSLEVDYEAKIRPHLGIQFKLQMGLVTALHGHETVFLQGHHRHLRYPEPVPGSRCLHHHHERPEQYCCDECWKLRTGFHAPAETGAG